MTMRPYGCGRFFKLLMACVWLAGAGTLASAAESFAHWDEHQLVLDNGVVRRVINLHAAGISTAQLTLADFAPASMVAPDQSAEFSFSLADGPSCNGTQGWRQARARRSRAPHAHRSATGGGRISGNLAPRA